MKASFTLAAIGASIAAAQSLDSLPECGRTCIQNMISIASGQLGCAQGDVTCYCTEPDFGYGVRDCANEACASSSDASTVISFGSSYCANALQEFTSTASQGAPTPTNSAGEVLSGGAGGAGATGSDGSSGSGSDATASGSATATSALVGMVTTDGSTLTTTTGSTTLYGGAAGSATSGAGSLTSGAGSAASSATDGANSAASSATDGADSAASSATDGANSAASSATDGANSAMSSATDGAASVTSEAGAAATGEQSGNVGPIQTAAPMLIGAAALAILAL